VARVELHGIRLRENLTAETERDVAATEARNVSRKDAKKIPLSSPFGKGGKRGILPKWRPADAMQDTPLW
jgi:hypothetical protein